MAGKNEKKSKTSKKNARRRAKKRSGVLTKVGARVLLRGSFPRPYMNVQGTDDGLTVRGMEIVETLNTSAVAKTKSIGLSPARAEMFPRLSGLALQFERFRFNRVRAHYFTACPATRSGSIGIAIHTEYTPDGKVPTTGPQFATYEYSRIGTIAESLSAPEWFVKDPEYFYIGSGSLAVEDKLKVYQGSLVSYVDNSTDADDDLIAGYLAIEYDVTFRSYRPTISRSVQVGQEDKANVTVTGGGRQVVTVPQLDEPSTEGQMTGYFGSKKMGEALDSKTAGTFNTLDVNQLVWDGLESGASWVYNYFMELEAKTLLIPRNPRGVKNLAPLSDVVVVNQADADAKSVCGLTMKQRLMVGDAPFRGWYNPAFCPRPETGYLPYPDDEKHDGGLPSRLMAMLPQADGDFTVTLYAYNPEEEKIAAVQTDSYTLGTGAVSVDDAHIVDLLDGYTVAFLGVVPTGTESRIVADLLLGWSSFTQVLS